MNARSDAAPRLLASVAVLVLLGGCGTGAGPTPGMATASPSSPTLAPTAAVVVTANVAYESANAVLVPGELDVYAPTAPGTWPVVVMFHGAPGGDPRIDRSGMAEKARAVSELGFVVFNASWGHVSGGGAEAPTFDELLATQSQATCAVRFAMSVATGYGGSPITTIAFGHSGGAHAAAMATFNGAEPTEGCLAGPVNDADISPAIDALVTWEGNWMLSVTVPDWDAALAADSRVMDVVTPWTHLAEHTDQKVVMLVSENPGEFFEREVGDPWSADTWLAARDPSGDLRRNLEANGAFTDGKLDFTETQALLYSVLEAQGNPVSLDVLPDSNHATLAGDGWKVFLAAFGKAAA